MEGADRLGRWTPGLSLLRARRIGALRADEELEADGVELAFAELKDPVRDRLRQYGIYDAMGDRRFFPTIGVAVATYLHATGVEWLDWEDRRPADDASVATPPARRDTRGST